MCKQLTYFQNLVQMSRRLKNISLAFFSAKVLIKSSHFTYCAALGSIFNLARYTTRIGVREGILLEGGKNLP